jgi:hypothetical protein
MAKSPILQIPVDQATWERVTGIAHREGVSIAAVGRDLVKKALPAREKLSKRRKP